VIYNGLANTLRLASLLGLVFGFPIGVVAFQTNDYWRAEEAIIILLSSICCAVLAMAFNTTKDS